MIEDHKGYFRGKPEHSDLISRQIAYTKIYLKNRDKFPLPFKKYVVHHIDREKHNNSVKNLDIVTKEEHNEIHRLGLADKRELDLYKSRLQNKTLLKGKREKVIILCILVIILVVFLVFNLIQYIKQIQNSKYESKCLEVCKNGLNKETSGSFYGKGYLYTIDKINERLTCLCKGESLPYNIILSNKTGGN